jgi:hypothetical protein
MGSAKKGRKPWHGDCSRGSDNTTAGIGAVKNNGGNMKPNSWMRYLVAAALVLLVGAVWALAEEQQMRVEVHSEDGKEISIDVNGVTETVTLDDLAEGEARTFDVGGHEVTVKRAGDRLALVHEGLMTGHHLGGHGQKIWIEGDEAGAGERRVMIIKRCDGETIDVDLDTDAMFFADDDAHDVFILRGEDGEIDIEALKEKYGDDFEEFHTAHGAHVMKWVGDVDTEHPIIVKRMGMHGPGNFVTYWCEETGSMLTVKADENLLDDYIDPVTGCIMKKVEHTGVHVIKIREEIITEDEHE